MRSNWLKKRLEIIPSTVIFIYDLRETSLIKENGFLTEYNKYKENLRSRHITSVFIFLISKTQQPIPDEILGMWKRSLEIDSKNIFFLPQSFESNIIQLKKLEKLIQEGSKTHYNELLKRHKKRLLKSFEHIQNYEFNLRILLKTAILYEFLLKTDKSQIQFEQAYSTIIGTLLPFYQSKISSASKSLPEYFYAANFEYIHRLEELRYLADLIKVRLFYQAIQKNDINVAHNLIYAHINLFKDKIEYLDSRFKFEDYKWKAGVYFFICNILLNNYETNPKFVSFDANYISSKIIAFCDSSAKRKEIFLQNNQNLIQEQNFEPSITVYSTYLGFARYKNPETGNIEIPKQTDASLINQILKGELYTEFKTNVYEDCINLLKRLLRNIKTNDCVSFLTEYALAQQYYLNGDKQKFLELVPQTLSSLEKNGWTMMVKDILLKNEKFLLQNNDWEGLITNCMKFFILSQDSQEREELIQKALSNLSQSSNFEFKVIDQNLFNLEVYFERSVIKYLHDFHGKIIMRIPKCLRKYIQVIELTFNDKNYKIEESIENFKREGDQDIYIFTMSAIHLVQNNRLHITEIKFKGSKTYNGADSNFAFVFKERAFLSNQKNILLLQLVDDLNLRIESNQPGYTNEKVDVLLRLYKKDHETKIKCISVFLYVYERGRIHDIEPGFFPRDITMYYVNKDSSLTEVNKDTNFGTLEFENDAQEMVLNFAVKATSEGKVTFVFKVKYDVIKIENGKMIEIPKELTEHFTSKTLSPFMHYLKWKTNLKEINHVRDSKTIIYRHPLPLNNTSCLNITFSSIYHDVIIQAMKVNLNRSSQILILKEPSSIQNLILFKNQLYTTHLLLKPIEEIDDLSLGNLELFIQRKEHESKSEKEPILLHVSLENISVHKRAFTVLVNVNTSCVVGSLTPYDVTIINNTYHLHKIDFMVQPNEAFYFSGHSKCVVDILPKSSKEIKLQMIPVEIGKHKAPTCVIKCLTLESEILLDTEETRIICVYPQNEERFI